jgi:hypothetical protein
MPAGVVLLGQVATHLPVLEVTCNRCDRRGRLIKPLRAYPAKSPRSVMRAVP